MLNNYAQLLQDFISRGYRACFFSELQHTGKGAILLRHDVDFDCKLAYKMALLENKLGIRSTYFFLISSEYYNIGYKENFHCIHEIKKLGHSISIHFDTSGHVDFRKGLISEINYFQELFNVEIDIISIHTPNIDIMENDGPILGIEHTYQSKYCRDIKYFSDSTGVWRFGNPLHSQEFRDKKNMQLLIHPIWWMLTSDKISNADKLRLYYNQRKNRLEDHYLINHSLISKIYEQVL
jgi:hypothetical protein